MKNFKKILGIVGILGLFGPIALNVVACGNEKSNSNNNIKIKELKDNLEKVMSEKLLASEKMIKMTIDLNKTNKELVNANKNVSKFKTLNDELINKLQIANQQNKEVENKIVNANSDIENLQSNEKILQEKNIFLSQEMEKIKSFNSEKYQELEDNLKNVMSEKLLIDKNLVKMTEKLAQARQDKDNLDNEIKNLQDQLNKLLNKYDSFLLKTVGAYFEKNVRENGDFLESEENIKKFLNQQFNDVLFHEIFEEEKRPTLKILEIDTLREKVKYNIKITNSNIVLGHEVSIGHILQK